MTKASWKGQTASLDVKKSGKVARYIAIKASQMFSFKKSRKATIPTYVCKDMA